MAFAADAARLRPGDIVLVEKPLGSSGHATSPHFFIVMHVPDPLRVGDRIPCLGITSRTADDAFDPERHVRMRWLSRRGGDPTTGLSKPSVASVTFRHVLLVEAGEVFALEAAAEHRGKFIRADHFQTLTAVANAYNRKLQQQQPPARDGSRPNET